MVLYDGRTSRQRHSLLNLYIGYIEYGSVFSSGCCNKVAQTGYFVNNRNVFFIVLEAGSPGSKYQHGYVIVSALFLFHSRHLVAVSFWWKGLENFLEPLL